MLGSDEDPGNFTGESRMRIFILLGSKKLCGEGILLLEGKFESFSCLPIYWGVILDWG